MVKPVEKYVDFFGEDYCQHCGEDFTSNNIHFEGGMHYICRKEYINKARRKKEGELTIGHPLGSAEEFQARELLLLWVSYCRRTAYEWNVEYARKIKASPCLHCCKHYGDILFRHNDTRLAIAKTYSKPESKPSGAAERVTC